MEQPNRYAVVAIPANNEADRIVACLAALATQRDGMGAPIAAGRFEVLVFANNCTDDTVATVAALAQALPHPVSVVAETLPADKTNAGWARKRAMDLAAERLIKTGRHDGLILTTDADSCVGPTWISGTWQAFAAGADCVAGYIDAHPPEIVRLGPGFLERGRLEDRYLRAVAEIYARCDPRPHDPWPNHRVSSGASLAVSLSAYLAIGGLPPKAVGEDAALARELDSAGFKVRHSMEIFVSTSCRFDGRAKGGAADTMQLRHSVLDAPCDDDLEPALWVVRRALLKGRLRRLAESGTLSGGAWAARLGLTSPEAAALVEATRHTGFEDMWERVAASSPALKRTGALRPADLPRQIARAEMALRRLRAGASGATGDPGDMPLGARSHEPEAA